ncbi:unnamed protein product [Thelazia callipaeda]|uniref:Autophagy-related protein 13 n=1 Tax=Thelazia callipaeda TaxID=103827 RepID=A0A0N5CQT8_THECL|nr:unnamed protein product [Thelazia callipaeda]
MSDSATSSKSYQEFVKFGKFFTTRLVQAVVQSRLGQLIVQTCSVSPDPSDWFSVRIDEIGEVAAQLRTSVTKYPPNANCFTLDFLLHTADGDILPLESWCIRYESELIDGSVSVRTEFYHQLGTLLKSAIVASRMTPAYRYYVRKQSPDTFIIMYRVYEKEPEMDLGEEQKKVRIGLVASPFGAFSLYLLYRTKMEIDRMATKRTNISSANVLKHAGTQQKQSSVDIDAPLSIPFGPIFVHDGEVKPEKIDDLWFGTPSRRVHFHLGHSRSSSDDACCRSHTCSDLDENSSQPYSSSLPHRLITTKNRSRTHSFPFSTLLTTAATDSFPMASGSTSATSIPAHIHQLAIAPSTEDSISAKESGKSEDSFGAEVQSDDDDLSSSDDSYVKVAFGSSESLADGLGEFMKQCRSAPTHLSFQVDCTAVIPELLEQFENNQIIFDSFLEEINRKTQIEDDVS